MVVPTTEFRNLNFTIEMPEWLVEARKARTNIGDGKPPEPPTINPDLHIVEETPPINSRLLNSFLGNLPETKLGKRGVNTNIDVTADVQDYLNPPEEGEVYEPTALEAISLEVFGNPDYIFNEAAFQDLAEQETIKSGELLDTLYKIMQS